MVGLNSLKERFMLRRTILVSLSVSLVAISLSFASVSTQEASTSEKVLFEKLTLLQTKFMEKNTALRKFEGEIARDAARIAQSGTDFCVNSWIPLEILKHVESESKRAECRELLSAHVLLMLRKLEGQCGVLTQLAEKTDDANMADTIRSLRDQIETANVELTKIVSEIHPLPNLRVPGPLSR